MANIREVAKRAGVSPSTVSYVLNNSRFVSKETRKRVLDAMKELDYRPNALARSLRLGETLNIGLILPSISNPYFAEMGEEIESAAFALGYNLILCNTEDDITIEQHYLDELCKKQVDGIVYIAAQNNPKNLSQMIDRTPCSAIVLVDRSLPFPQLDSVYTDNIRGAYLATQHLIEAGHERIGCITGMKNFSPTNERVEGYKKALEDANLVFDAALIYFCEDNPESSRVSTFQLLELQQKPTAIFATNDIMAIGVLRALRQCGISIPDDVALIGYDGIKLTSYTNPSLSTIAQPKKEIAQNAIRLLIERIGNSSLEPRNVILQPELIIRESTIGTKGGDRGKI